MEYRVIKYFTDLQDNNYHYHVGDTFPHDGFEVSQERIDELSSEKNKRGVKLIEAVEGIEDIMPKPVEPIKEEVKEETKKPVRKSSKKEKDK